MQYDEVVIQKFASQLYARARFIVTVCMLLGLLGGGVLGFVLGGGVAAAGGGGVSPLVLLVPAVIGACIGYWFGTGRAFMLRFTAQSALCQAQIERNTRRA